MLVSSLVSFRVGYLVGANVPPEFVNFLPPDRYHLIPIEHLSSDISLDCLLIFNNEIPSLELPIVVITQVKPDNASTHLYPDQLEQLLPTIEDAIAEFLTQTDRGQTISNQQHRLSEKLQERLGYLGVYYKRNPDQFLRAMLLEDRRDYLAKLEETYKEIILEYFKQNPDRLNQKIDEFATMAFLADISVSQVLEIHLNLMELLSKQLRIEGHKDEILLDYRITLIDVIAHLCEMYRRSIPPKGGKL